MLKNLIFCILLFGNVFSNAQQTIIRSPKSDIESAVYYLMSGNNDSAIIYMNHAINKDSICGNLYLIRGYIELWEPKLYEKQAIKDFELYISFSKITQVKSCICSDTLTKNLIQRIINYNHPGEHGEFALTFNSELILKGVIAIIQNKKDEACEIWNELKNSGNCNINSLIERFCN